MPVKITKTVVDTVSRAAEPKSKHKYTQFQSHNHESYRFYLFSYTETTGNIPVQPVRQVYSKTQAKKDENVRLRERIYSD